MPLQEQGWKEVYMHHGLHTYCKTYTGVVKTPISFCISQYLSVYLSKELGNLFGDSSRNAGIQARAGDGGLHWKTTRQMREEVPFSLRTCQVWEHKRSEKQHHIWVAVIWDVVRKSLRGNSGAQCHTFKFEILSHVQMRHRESRWAWGHSSFVLMCGSKNCRWR